MARTRKRFWAKTLTLTAALLAVVWVWSMRAGAGVRLPRGNLSVAAGAFNVLWVTQVSSRETKVWANPSMRWKAYWWFNRAEWPQSNGGRAIDWTIPLWPFILVTGVPGVWMLVKTRKR